MCNIMYGTKTKVGVLNLNLPPAKIDIHICFYLCSLDMQFTFYRRKLYISSLFNDIVVCFSACYISFKMLIVKTLCWIWVKIKQKIYLQGHQGSL